MHDGGARKPPFVVGTSGAGDRSRAVSAPPGATSTPALRGPNPDPLAVTRACERPVSDQGLAVVQVRPRRSMISSGTQTVALGRPNDGGRGLM